MTAPIDIDAYLARIGYCGPRQATHDTLRGLQRAHLLTVPFENLDIHRGREIVLDEARIVEKIVVERRGGFCYELNAAFAALLREMGFAVTLLSAGVSHNDGTFGPDFDHMLLRVDLDEPWLADVGFGDSIAEPIRLIDDMQRDGDRQFQIERDGNFHTLRLRDGGGDWQAQHRFTLTPHALAEFTRMCHFQQTSPASHFTHGPVCSRSTLTGRISLTGDRLIVTGNGQRHETPIANDAAFSDALQRHFGIVLPAT